MNDSWSTFFDPSKARGPRRSPDVGSEDGGDGRKNAPLSISQLLRQVKGTLAAAMPGSIYVLGQISNFKLHSSGHMYFRLKDADAAIDAAMFRSAAGKLKFTPQDGMEVVARGRVDVYEIRGQLQFYVQSLSPQGAGALELAFRQLREKLQGEGLFDPSVKKPIPRFPRAIGVITSATGAVIRDIRRTLARRWCGVKTFLLPVAVQGDRAAGEIADAVGLLDEAAGPLGIDTIIVARGGGNLEDLWPFNEEILARAIFAARTPIISGVGHETDVTICDMVADARAATPTAAAALAVPDRKDILRQLLQSLGRIDRNVRNALETARASLDAVQRSVVFRDPSAGVRSFSQRIDELSHRLRAAQHGALSRARSRLEPDSRRLASLHPARLLERARSRLAESYGRLRWTLGARNKNAGDKLAAMLHRLAAVHPRNGLKLARQQVSAATRQLEAMSYRSVLKRGYSVTRGEHGAVIRSVRHARKGERMETQVADGTFTSVVTEESTPARRKKSTGGMKSKQKKTAPTLFD